MSEGWLIMYGYLIGGVMAVVFGGLVIYLLTKKNTRTRQRSFWDYYLIWPLLIEDFQQKADRRSKRGVVVGLLVMALLVIAAVISNRR
ncbi:hypothetical protein [Pseudoduganella violaceinigra]|uniref:hypothetical protein n=1 Tax=Pseudoduganella violaceinigra TaxID=246602 RepID=UPI000481BC34|nr:hypothetical protein [Pseudoduganella violaceinigra]